MFKLEVFFGSKELKQAELFSVYSDLNNSYVHFVLRRGLDASFFKITT